MPDKVVMSWPKIFQTEIVVFSSHKIVDILKFEYLKTLTLLHKQTQFPSLKELLSTNSSDYQVFKMLGVFF